VSISVVVLTLNEEDRISRCLKSVSWADEIIVVDSFSSDATADLASKFTDNILFRKFDSFSAQRSFAVEQAKGDWVFFLDADEVVSEGFEKEVRDIVNDSSCCAYRVDRLEFFMGDFICHGGFGLGQHNHHIRLWRKGSGFFVGDVHEKLVVNGDVGRMKSHILHYSNEGSISGFIQKIDKYTSMELSDSLDVYSGGDCSLHLSPLKRFFGRLFWFGGYKDGVRGLIYFSLFFFYDFVSCAKKFEKKMRK